MSTRPAFLNEYPLTGTIVPPNNSSCRSRVGGTAAVTGAAPNIAESTTITYTMSFDGFTAGSFIRVVYVSNNYMNPARFVSGNLQAGNITLNPGQRWMGKPGVGETAVVTLILQVFDGVCVRTVDLHVTINLTTPMSLVYLLESDEYITIAFTGPYKVIVDWGSGLVARVGSGSLISPTVLSSGPHTIRIWGSATGFYRQNFETFLGMTNAGDLGYTMVNMTSAFEEWHVLNGFLPNTDWTRNVTNMTGMFDHSDFNQPISDWDVSSVTIMDNMFSSSGFNQPIGGWDTSKVTSMHEMFRQSVFDQAIGDWNVSDVVYMSSMFMESQFNQPIGEWDTSSVKHMEYMFRSSDFNQDIKSWDTSSVESMRQMFFESDFNQDIDTNGGNWNTANVKDMSQMFESSAFNYSIGNWDITGSSLNDMFKLNTSFSNVNSESTFGGWIPLNTVKDLGSVPNSVGPNRNYLVNNLGWTITN